MELLTEATALAAAAVLVMTELLKLVPVRFTTDHAAWVNAGLSLVASVWVVQPSLALDDIGATLATALLIAVVAALSYNQFTSKVVNLGDRG
jgi:hypothetical protein